MYCIVIMEANGYTADRYIEIADDNGNLDRLKRSGVIREASGRDRDRLSRVEHVRYAMSSASWGSGAYVLDQADELYVVISGFTLHHVDLAIRRMMDQAAEAKRADLFARIDAVN